MNNSLKVLYFPVGQIPQVVELPKEDHLKQMQELVGGLVDCIRGPFGTDLWCNDEGLILGLPLQKRFVRTRPIAGNFFLSGGADEEGNTVGLTDEQIALLTKESINVPVFLVDALEELY